MDQVVSFKNLEGISPNYTQLQMDQLDDTFNRCLNKFGIKKRLLPVKNLQHFLNLSPEKQANFVSLTKLTGELLEQIENEQSPDGNTWDITLEKEISFLKRALKAFNLELSDESILDRLKEGDLFEVYNTEGIQIYRSWSLFEYTSYSLVDLLNYSWDELYDRPSFVRNYLYKMVDDLLVKRKNQHIYDIPAYVIHETMPLQNNKMLFQMEYAVATLDSDTKEPKGFLTTGKAQTLNSDVSSGVHVI